MRSIIITLLLFFVEKCFASKHLRKQSLDFDANLVQSLVLPSGLDSFDQDLGNRLFNRDTETFLSLFNSTKDYLKTLPVTDQLLNGLSPNEGTFYDDYAIKRIAHWIHIYNTISEWSKEQTSTQLMAWVSSNDAYMENFCDSVLVQPMETNEFDQSLGAPEKSCLKRIYTDFGYQKYIGVREAYMKILRNGDIASEGSVELIKNIYEAVYVDFKNGREANSIIGDRLIAMNRGLPVFSGRNCTSQGCMKNATDDFLCLSIDDLDHVERNCTVSQEYVDRYTEWNLNFGFSVSQQQDSYIAGLLFPALHEDPASYFFERLQSLYFTGVSSAVRLMLNPFKKRQYFSEDDAFTHAENVLEAWIDLDPNLTSWTDIDDPPTNEIDPTVDPVNAEVGDWMNYFDDLATDTSARPFFAWFITFLRVRCYFGFFIPSDVV